jgi:hypothetical protein
VAFALLTLDLEQFDFRRTVLVQGFLIRIKRPCFRCPWIAVGSGLARQSYFPKPLRNCLGSASHRHIAATVLIRIVGRLAPGFQWLTPLDPVSPSHLRYREALRSGSSTVALKGECNRVEFATIEILSAACEYAVHIRESCGLRRKTGKQIQRPMRNCELRMRNERLVHPRDTETPRKANAKKAAEGF